MKKFRIIALLGFFALMFSGCTKDLGELIVGTWDVDKITYETYVAGELIESEQDLNVGQITFKSGGAGFWVEGEDSEDITWSSEGENLTIITNDGTISLKMTTMESDKMVGEFVETVTAFGITSTFKMKIYLSK